MDNLFNIAIVGATGAVGDVLLELLAEREFPVGNLSLLAGENSAGKRLMWMGKSHLVTNVADFDFKDVDIALFSAGGDVSKEYAPKAAAAGAVVIDNTSAFRYDDEIPLVVSEVNPDALPTLPKQGEPGFIVANPNCSTMQLMVALAPIHRAVGLKSMHIATYQSVSGAGRRAMEYLGKETANMLSFRTDEESKSPYPVQMAFNVIAQIDRLEDNEFTREEMKLVWESHKILNDDGIAICATAVRVPVFFGHAEAVHFQTRDSITKSDMLDLLRSAPGLELVENAAEVVTPVTHAAGTDPVYVSRLRVDPAHENGFACWVVADNVRKGAALNAVQIAELLVNSHL